MVLLNREVSSILRTPQGNYLICILDNDDPIQPGVFREVLVRQGDLGSFIESYFTIPDWKGGVNYGESKKDAS